MADVSNLAPPPPPPPVDKKNPFTFPEWQRWLSLLPQAVQGYVQQSPAGEYAPLNSPHFTGTVVITGAITGITKAEVGLSNVDNTSDANKPVSTSTAAQLALKALLTNLLGLAATSYTQFTAGRVAGTPYVAPALRPLAISIGVQFLLATDTAVLVVAGANVFEEDAVVAGAKRISINAIIPQGATYQLNLSGSATKIRWGEL